MANDRLGGLWGNGFVFGGMYLNDACDVAFDREHRKERPIPSGAISESAVWKIGIGLLAVGMGALSIQGGATALLALGLFNCILIYNFTHKKLKWSPLLIALCRWLLIMTAAAFAFVTIKPEMSFFGDSNSGMAAWVASVLCLYVVGLSCLAKVESEPGLVRFWPCLLLGAPVLLAMFVNPGGEDRKMRCWSAQFWGCGCCVVCSIRFGRRNGILGKQSAACWRGLCWWICWRYSMWLRRWRRCFSDCSFWL